jgi:hypothetical protein
VVPAEVRNVTTTWTICVDDAGWDRFKIPPACQPVMAVAVHRGSSAVAVHRVGAVVIRHVPDTPTGGGRRFPAIDVAADVPAIRRYWERLAAAMMLAADVPVTGRNAAEKTPPAVVPDDAVPAVVPAWARPAAVADVDAAVPAR